MLDRTTPKNEVMNIQNSLNHIPSISARNDIKDRCEFLLNYIDDLEKHRENLVKTNNQYAIEHRESVIRERLSEIQKIVK